MWWLLISYSFNKDWLNKIDLVLVIKTKVKIGQNQGVLVLVLINQNNIATKTVDYLTVVIVMRSA